MRDTPSLILTLTVVLGLLVVSVPVSGKIESRPALRFNGDAPGSLPNCNVPTPQRGSFHVPSDGAARWSLGAAIKTAPCQPDIYTPMIPAGTDTGSMTAPYSTSWPTDERCAEGTNNHYALKFTASLQDASYDGRTPFAHFQSHAGFQLPTDSKSWTASGTLNTKAECIAEYRNAKTTIERKAYEWLQGKLDHIEVSVDCKLGYVRLSDGSYLLTVSGSGTAVLNYDPITFSDEVGTRDSWDFEVTCEDTSNPTNAVVVVEGYGESSRVL